MARPIHISKPIIEKEEIDAVVDILKKGQLSMGPKTKLFEEQFAEYCGTKYAVAVNSGTATLHCILHSLDLQEDDEIITTPFTFVATANAILMERAKVVFADIENETFNLDSKSVEEKITPNTKAIMVVDLFGHMFDVEAFEALSKKHNIPLIADSAQAVGAKYKNRMAGSIGLAGSFSLYATKNLTSGVGGILTTDDEHVYESSKLFRHHGQTGNTMYDYVEFGFNYRMQDMTAVIAIEQLMKIEGFTDARRANAEKLLEGLKDIKGIVLPVEKKDYKHVYHQFTIRVTDDYVMSRDELLEKLNKKEIMAKVYYPRPLHLFPQFKDLGLSEGDLPVSEQSSLEVLSLPVHPLVDDEDIQYIIDTMKELSS